LPDKVRKWRDETIKMVQEAIEEFRCIACRPSDIRAYGSDGILIKNTKFAVEKMRKAGYLYEPLTNDKTVVLVILPKKQKKALGFQKRYPPESKTQEVT